MTDQELEQLLREVALEGRTPVDPRWEALTRGELSDEEASVLTASDPELAELFRPLPVLEAWPSAVEEPAPTPTPANRPSGWVAVLALLAAAVLVFSVLPGSGLLGGSEPLPTYAITVSGGVQQMRSTDPTEVPVLAPGTPIVLRLRPATQPDSPVQVQVFASGRQLETIQVNQARTGAVEIIVESAPPGTTELTVVLGSPGDDGNAQRFRVPIQIR